MVYTWDKANANTPSTRTTQYFEMFGNRAIYHEGWVATTTPPAPPWLMGLATFPDVINGYKWELYHIADDYSENYDLAATKPGKLRELQELFLVEAAKYQVFPLDNSILPRLLAPKPSYTAGRTEFIYSGELSGTPSSDAPNILAKSYTITAEVEIPQGGAEGMLVTDGGRFGGYGLYLLKGKPVFLYNLLALERFRWQAKDALAPGKHTIVFDFEYDGPGMSKGGTGVLSVDGEQIDSKKIPHTIPALLTIDESFDVGVDTRTGVEDKDYQVPFRFTGKLGKVKIKLIPPPPEVEKRLKRKAQEAKNATQ
jgi:arylsulfatase